MTRSLARTALVAVLAAAALAAAGCGDKSKYTTSAATEGIWVDAGPLQYTIQGSRLLNPGETPDGAYLCGLPIGAKPLDNGKEVWFAVFLRVENNSDGSARTAQNFTITDTRGTTFHPLAMRPSLNPFVYQPRTLAAGEFIPIPDSPQFLNSFSGAELLFRIPLVNYSQRPLTLHIQSAGGTGPRAAQIGLDV
jgi:hypothetical protein